MAQAPSPPPLFADLGDDQKRAYEAVCSMRMAQRSVDAEPTSLLSRASSLFGKSGGAMLSAWVDRGTNMSKFKRYGLLPEDFVQSQGITYARLRNAGYDLTSLVEFGFRWQHLLQLGFDVEHLSAVTTEEYSALGVTANEIVRDLPFTADDLARLKLQPHVLRELKFNMTHFISLGVTSEQLQRMMTAAELQTYFHPTPQQMTQLGTPHVAPAAARAPRTFHAHQAGGLAF